jgi:hypothetical protein
MTWLIVTDIFFTDDHGYVRNTSVSNNEAGNVYPYKEPNFFLKFSGLHVAQSLVFCVVFIYYFLSFVIFPFALY